MKKYIDIAVEEIKKELLPRIPIKKFKIIKVYRKQDYLGFYENFSVNDIPIIKLNIPAIKQAGKEYNILSIYEIILSTIIHELGHAIQELKGKMFDEEKAENFAYDYLTFGTINTRGL